MRTALTLVTLAVLTVAAAAQTAPGSAMAQAGGASSMGRQSTGISAELTKKIDSKDAKVGDEVVAKTTAKARLVDGTVLPKGSKLLGHVTEAQAESRANRDAHLAFAFDHAVLRDGREIPVRTMVRSISAPPPVAPPSMDAAGDGMGGADAQGGGRGSLVGRATGTVKGVSDGTDDLPNNVASGVDSTMNGATGAASGLGRTSAQLGSTAGSVGNLSGVTFSTVDLSGDASHSGVGATAGASSATLLSAHGRNFTLESGSQMTMSLSAQ